MAAAQQEVHVRSAHLRVNSYNNVTEQRLFTHLEMLPG